MIENSNLWIRIFCKTCGKGIGRDRLILDHEMFIREHEHQGFGISVENRKNCGCKDDEICEICSGLTDTEAQRFSDALKQNDGS